VHTEESHGSSNRQERSHAAPQGLSAELHQAEAMKNGPKALLLRRIQNSATTITFPSPATRDYAAALFNHPPAQPHANCAELAERYHIQDPTTSAVSASRV